MRRLDKVLPWGREDDGGLITEQLQEKSYRTHRKALAEATPLVDSLQLSAPGSLSDLFNTGKKAQLRKDRTEQINNDNRKMVERMAETIRNGGPTLHGPFIEAHPRKDYEGAAMINMRRRNRKIGEENRRLRAAISNIKPEISAEAHAKAYARSSAARSSMSLAVRRQERSRKHQKLKQRHVAQRQLELHQQEQQQLRYQQQLDAASSGLGDGTEPSQSSSSSSSSSAGVGGAAANGSVTVGLRQLRTARHVRSAVAEWRGEALPAWLLADKPYAALVSNRRAAATAATATAAVTTGTLGKGASLKAPKEAATKRPTAGGDYVMAGGKVVVAGAAVGGGGGGGGERSSGVGGGGGEGGGGVLPLGMPFVTTAPAKSSGVGMRRPLRAAHTARQQRQEHGPGYATGAMTAPDATQATTNRLLAASSSREQPLGSSGGSDGSSGGGSAVKGTSGGGGGIMKFTMSHTGAPRPQVPPMPPV